MLTSSVFSLENVHPNEHSKKKKNGLKRGLMLENFGRTLEKTTFRVFSSVTLLRCGSHAVD